MIAFMLDDACMETFDSPLDAVSVWIEACITQMLPARNHAAQSGYGEAALPVLLQIFRQRDKNRIDQNRVRDASGFWIARIDIKAENHHAQPDSDLRRGKTGAIQMAHGLLHIGNQSVQFRRIESIHLLRALPQAGITHSKNRTYHRIRPDVR